MRSPKRERQNGRKSMNLTITIICYNISFGIVILLLRITTVLAGCSNALKLWNTLKPTEAKRRKEYYGMILFWYSKLNLRGG
jgi:hypothetical protein